MGVKMMLAGGAAAWGALKAYEIKAKMSGWSYEITNTDRLGIVIAGALLGLGFQEITMIMERVEK